MPKKIKKVAHPPKLERKKRVAAYRLSQMKPSEKVKLFRVIESAGIEDSAVSVKSACVQRSNSKAKNT